MDLPELWGSLEAAAARVSVGIVTRRISASIPFDLLIGISCPDFSRLLMLRVDRAARDPHLSFLSSRGFQVTWVALPDDPPNRICLQLHLANKAYADVFDALITDLGVHIRAANSEADALRRLHDRVAKWQRFVERQGAEGLSIQERRGLFGEIWCLKEWLIQHLGRRRSVEAWVGPLAAPHDFEVGAIAIEVKATASGDVIRISNALQLENQDLGDLFLAILSIDADTARGVSLPAIVDEVRNSLACDADTLAKFDDRLLESGYSDAQRAAYAGDRFHVRNAQPFHVRDGFPRIIAANLMPGIVDVEYAISIRSCAAFAVEESEFLDRLRSVA